MTVETVAIVFCTAFITLFISAVVFNFLSLKKEIFSLGCQIATINFKLDSLERHNDEIYKKIEDINQRLDDGIEIDLEDYFPKLEEVFFKFKKYQNDKDAEEQYRNFTA